MSEFLMETAQLAEEIKGSKIKLLQCSFEIPSTVIRIPNSFYIYLTEDLQTLVEVLKKLSFELNTKILCYDDGSLEAACRVWWGLQAAGYTNSCVLNGGITKWVSEYGTVQRGAPLAPPMKEDFYNSFNEAFYCTQEDLAELGSEQSQKVVAGKEFKYLVSEHCGLKEMQEVVLFFKTSEIDLIDTRLTAVSGEMAGVVVFLLKVLGRNNLSVCIEHPERTESTETVYYSYSEAFIVHRPVSSNNYSKTQFKGCTCNLF